MAASIQDGVSGEVPSPDATPTAAANAASKRPSIPPRIPTHLFASNIEAVITSSYNNSSSGTRSQVVRDLRPAADDSDASSRSPSLPSPGPAPGMAVGAGVEVDEFGLPIRKFTNRVVSTPVLSTKQLQRASTSRERTPVPKPVAGEKPVGSNAEGKEPNGIAEPVKQKESEEAGEPAKDDQAAPSKEGKARVEEPVVDVTPAGAENELAKSQKPDATPKKSGVIPDSDSDDDKFEDAISDVSQPHSDAGEKTTDPKAPPPERQNSADSNVTSMDKKPENSEDAAIEQKTDKAAQPSLGSADKQSGPETLVTGSDVQDDQQPATVLSKDTTTTISAPDHRRESSVPGNLPFVSEFSHQHVITKPAEVEEDEAEWQEMPSYAPYDMYNDDNKLIAREHNEDEEDEDLGGAGKGYTRVIMDDDAQSATSLDENTQYLFKEVSGTSVLHDEEQRDAVSQMQATKDLLTEGQRIAYVGVARLHIFEMVKEADNIERSRKTKKEVSMAAEAARMWAQKMMIRLYAHMDISSAEQIMIEQLAEHGVRPDDLTPVLMANSRVKNPMADEGSCSSVSSGPKSPHSPLSPTSLQDEKAATPPPAYERHAGEDMPDVKTPSQLPSSSNIDIDIRWTVLCDLFLVLIADSVYDARSRTLLERVGQSLDITWLDICRFEKRVTDALEMQQAADKEDWNEDDHMESRRKMALKKRYVMMGLATVGGGLVIGLSAGLLAPMIGAGLAAGFTTIGVTGTSGFLAGAGGAAVITTSAAASGSIIGGRAANRRMGSVRTFEYRPLHNNKRVNLIVTVSGWMTGKMDDVRLPFSTVDSIMGDIYSILWEPEMLRSMGDTINILATEALTQGLQQVLGSTILVALMSALQLPVVLTKLSYLIDNPWAVSLDRATSAGLILADSICDRNLGARPITLVGYSLGSRVIFSCLQELARKGAYGLVQNVYLFGSPIVVKQDEYIRARTVVSGRFVNGYNRNDWILGYLFRLTNGGIRRVAGLIPIDNVPWIENIDVTDLVKGHMEYRAAMPRLLRECGWLVESDEFTEIEDPDPDDHQARQRELINEIEEARRELEREGKASKGGAFSFFSRKKKGERAEWEVYKEPSVEDGDGKKDGTEQSNHGVLFDVDAIRAKLAEENIEVRELESTLPPMKLDLAADDAPAKLPSTPLAMTPRAPDRLATGGLGLGRDDSHGLPYRSPTLTPRLSAERTPTPVPSYQSSLPYRQPSPSYLSGDPTGANDHADEDGIQMTFDTSFSNYSSPPKATGPPSPPPKEDQPTWDSPAPVSSRNAPVITVHDPWADSDEDFGKEKEIQMTFA